MSIHISNKKILITGGLGFIGSNLARRLVEHGNTITVVDSLIPEYGGNLRNLYDIQDTITVNLSDVRDVSAINDLIKGHDYLFNLAGQTSHLDSMHDPITDLDINAKAQLSILEACENSTRYSHCLCSTSDLWKTQVLSLDENTPSPVDVNGINKIAGEQYHIPLSRSIWHCFIRAPSNQYLRTKNAHQGCRQTFLGIWIRTYSKENRFKSLAMASNRDYNYVEDVLDALLIAQPKKMLSARSITGAPIHSTLRTRQR